jgi:hypothetical protein
MKHNRARPIPADLPHSPRPIWKLREVADSWPSEYNNEERPHDSLGRAPPLTCLPGPQAARESNMNNHRLKSRQFLGRA